MMTKTWIFLLGLLGTMLLSHSPAWAAEEAIQAIRIDNINPEALARTAPGDVSLVYDPSQFPVPKDLTPITPQQVEDALNEMRTPEYQKKLESEVVVADYVDKKELIDIYSNLSEKDQAQFIAKKSKYLEKVAKTLSFFRVPASKVNKIVGKLNESFFENAPLVADANTRVTTIGFGGAAGIGLADFIMKYLKKSPLLKNLPDKTGFYFSFNLGFSLVRTIKDGKNKFSFEPVLELRRATEIFSPFAMVAVAATFTQTWENRNYGDFAQKAKFFKVSVVNTISGESTFGFTTAFAIPFPPMGGIAAGMVGDAYRIPIHLDTPKHLFNVVVHYFKTFGKMACGKALL